MLGCCHRQGEKYISENGDIDIEKLPEIKNKINSMITFSDIPDHKVQEETDKIMNTICTCGCHIPESGVMC